MRPQSRDEPARVVTAYEVSMHLVRMPVLL
jgi:hypothetical protein